MTGPGTQTGAAEEREREKKTRSTLQPLSPGTIQETSQADLDSDTALFMAKVGSSDWSFVIPIMTGEKRGEGGWNWNRTHKTLNTVPEM